MGMFDFCIPISAKVDAPIDVVWGALMDLGAWPTIYSGIVETNLTEEHSRYGGSANGGEINAMASLSSRGTGGSARTQGDDSQGSSKTPSMLGSRWTITRRGILERQRYSMAVTITQFTEQENKRSFTISTHQALGATCSVKMSVETMAKRPTSVTTNNTATSTENDMRQEQANNQDTSLPDASAPCLVTFMTTMIPYKLAVKLLGVMCCPCLLRYRVRISMAADLEDFTRYCEEKVADAARRGIRPDEVEGRRTCKRKRKALML